MPKHGRCYTGTMKLWISYALVVGWMAVIFVLSSEGHDASSGRSDAIVQALQAMGVSWQVDLLTFLTRKAAHTVAYLMLGVLAFNVVRQYRLSGRMTVAVSVLVVALYAMSDEIHQLFVPGRSGEVRDVLIDSAAGLLGVFLAKFVYSKYLLRKSQR